VMHLKHSLFCANYHFLPSCVAAHRQSFKGNLVTNDLSSFVSTDYCDSFFPAHLFVAHFLVT